MAEYIEREAAVKALNRLCDRVCQYSKKQRKYMCGACPLGDAFTVIEDDIPAADVRPVVRGKWRLYSPLTDTYECDKCGYQVIDESFRTNYCPNCGCAMEES